MCVLLVKDILVIGFYFCDLFMMMIGF